jgi:phage recombination protein Bet
VNDIVATQNMVPATLSNEKIDLIKRTICKGASDDELQMFLHHANRTGLDPLARQIYAVFRLDKNAERKVMSIQTSIDGFRLVAERSGKYAGQIGPEWCGEDGQWKDVWISKEPPHAARVGVIRSDFKEPLYAVARFDAYAQRYFDRKTGKMSASQMWLKMSDVMTAKCAEALALRRAFPHELSGLYIDDEMGAQDNPVIDPGHVKGGRSRQVETSSKNPSSEWQGARSKSDTKKVYHMLHAEMDNVQYADIFLAVLKRFYLLISDIKKNAENNHPDALLWWNGGGEFVGLKGRIDAFADRFSVTTSQLNAALSGKQWEQPEEDFPGDMGPLNAG